ncbi:UDP-N-acetylglucosamine 2-epimerase (non-hydrolyzing) [Streptomyces sp. NPDC050315]|uniref:non-hydrolyzing UDP-N-acetylglucosamine 2-epimerase n=1 Tax=Streptomyces sp. NPDC050315 TaxID=3155039 RepID=UPI003418E0A4
MRTVAIVLGTRPEAIKCAPVIKTLREDPRFNTIVVSTGQHKEMLEETLDAFDLKPDIDLGIMRPKQTLSGVTYRILRELPKAMEGVQADAVLVHGDTATTLAGALFGFQHRIPVVHIEAGLRSGDLGSPFPDEGNRRLVGQLASLHLAPTPGNSANLIREGIAEQGIVVTGNTVIDALRWAADKSASYGDPRLDDLDDDPRRVVLASAHRREGWERIPDIARALVRIADRPDTRVVLPLHRNPVVREAMLPIVAGHPDITVVDPLDYLSFCRLMQRCDIILSDSSGAEEEGPALGKPTLVLRDITERPEAVVAGTARLVGRSTDRLVAEVSSLLDSDENYRRMATSANPYGDGRATERTVGALARFFGEGPAVPPFVPGSEIDAAASALVSDSVLAEV